MNFDEFVEKTALIEVMHEAVDSSNLRSLFIQKMQNKEDSGVMPFDLFKYIQFVEEYSEKFSIENLKNTQNNAKQLLLPE